MEKSPSSPSYCTQYHCPYSTVSLPRFEIARNSDLPSLSSAGIRCNFTTVSLAYHYCPLPSFQLSLSTSPCRPVLVCSEPRLRPVLVVPLYQISPKKPIVVFSRSWHFRLWGVLLLFPLLPTGWADGAPSIGGPLVLLVLFGAFVLKRSVSDGLDLCKAFAGCRGTPTLICLGDKETSFWCWSAPILPLLGLVSAVTLHLEK